MRKEITRLGQLKCQTALPAEAAVSMAKAKPALLLVHGLGGGIWGWERFQEYFARQGYRTFAIELPGHAPPDPLRNGNGHRPDEYLGICSVETYALHVAAAMDELGPCIVIGHSMGGLIAQKLAEAHRQLGYVFLASAPPWHMFRRAYAPLWKHLLLHPWSQFLAPLSGSTLVLDHSLQEKLVNNRLPPEVREDIYHRDVPDSGRASMQMVAGLVSVDIRRVDSPCLVVGGLEDRLIPASEQRKLAERYHCAIQLYDRGHMLMIEPGAEEVAGGIERWIEARSMEAQSGAQQHTAAD